MALWYIPSQNYSTARTASCQQAASRGICRQGGTQMDALDRTAGRPLYLQLKEILLDRIRIGQLQSGDKLPTERELEVAYGVSRMTARHALNELAAVSLVHRRRGGGTFVTNPKIQMGLDTATGFSAEMRARGLAPSGRILRLAEVIPPEDVAAALELRPGARAVYLRRLRMADGVPMALEGTYVPADRFAGLVRERMVGGSLHQTLRERYGVHLRQAHRTVESATADARQARLLGTPTGAPLLLVQGLNLDQHGQVVEYGWTAYRGDRYKLYLRSIPHR